METAASTAGFGRGFGFFCCPLHFEALLLDIWIAVAPNHSSRSHLELLTALEGVPSHLQVGLILAGRTSSDEVGAVGGRGGEGWKRGAVCIRSLAF